MAVGTIRRHNPASHAAEVQVGDVDLLAGISVRPSTPIKLFYDGGLRDEGPFLNPIVRFQILDESGGFILNKEVAKFAFGNDAFIHTLAPALEGIYTVSITTSHSGFNPFASVHEATFTLIVDEEAPVINPPTDDLFGGLFRNIKVIGGVAVGLSALVLITSIAGNVTR